jgi:hypothetical protein
MDIFGVSPVPLPSIGSEEILIRLQRLDQTDNEIGCEPHVVVHEHCNIAAGALHSEIVALREPVIPTECDPSDRIAPSYFRRTIGAPIVRDQHLERIVRLLCERLEASVKMAGAVEVQHDDGYESVHRRIP